MGSRPLQLTSLVAAGTVLGHAALSWSPGAAFAFAAIVGGLALAAEVVAVRLGLLVHHTRPRVGGVPLAALAGWIGIVYASTQLATVTLGRTSATPFLAGATAAVIDGALDPVGVRAGWWSYPQSPVSRLRYAGVPWWNAVAWFVLATISSEVAIRIAS